VGKIGPQRRREKVENPKKKLITTGRVGQGTTNKPMCREIGTRIQWGQTVPLKDEKFVLEMDTEKGPGMKKGKTKEGGGTPALYKPGWQGWKLIWARAGGPNS